MSAPKYDSRGFPYTEEATLTRESEEMRRDLCDHDWDDRHNGVSHECQNRDRLAAIEAAVRAEQAAEVERLRLENQGIGLHAVKLEAEVERLRAALDELMVLRTEHGLNCYVTEEVGCLCGLDETLERITDVRLGVALAATPVAPAPAATERCAEPGCVWKRGAHPGQPNEHATHLTDHPFQPEPRP